MVQRCSLRGKDILHYVIPTSDQNTDEMAGTLAVILGNEEIFNQGRGLEKVWVPEGYGSTSQSRTPFLWTDLQEEKRKFVYPVLLTFSGICNS